MRIPMWLVALFAGTSAFADQQHARMPEAAVDGPIHLTVGNATTALPISPKREALNSNPESCPAQASRVRGMRLQRALSHGFGVQYWGEDYSADGLAAQPHGLLIIEITKVGAPYSDSEREILFDADEIALISKGGTRPVIGYLNVGEIESYRDYWIDILNNGDGNRPAVLPPWYGPTHGNGDHLAAFWVPEWKDLMLAHVDRLMATGVDGLFLDDVLQYYSYVADPSLVWPDQGTQAGMGHASYLARAMMDLVVAIGDRMRTWNCDAYLIVNNAIFIGRDAAGAPDQDSGRPKFDAYLASIDAIMIENMLGSAEQVNARQAVTEDFLESGLQVLALDVLSRHSLKDVDALRLQLNRESTAAGFVPYFADDDGFSRLWAPVRHLAKN